MEKEVFEKVLKAQGERIHEMEQIISLLEEENSLQKQLIEHLQAHNAVLQKHLDDYSDAVHRMLDDSAI